MNQELLKIALELLEDLEERAGDEWGKSEATSLESAIKLIKLASKGREYNYVTSRIG